MEIYDRIKHLRKNVLGMTRKVFSEAIGISPEREVNLERDVLVKPELNEPIYRLICREFNVRKEWLKEGIEPIFEPARSEIFAQVAEEIGFNEREARIMRRFASLPAEKRQVAWDFLDIMRTIWPDDVTPPQLEYPKEDDNRAGRRAPNA